jgi:hypothetical protein
MIWKGIDPQWRTDTEQGRRNIIHFFITEPLKALLEADLPEPEVWAFISDLIDRAGTLDTESFIRDVCTQEQGAEEIFILNSTFPLITMPIDIGPWDSRNSIRTRQLVFYALVKEIAHVQFILSQKSIETYWMTGQYGRHTFPREWVVRHIQTFQTLLLKFPEKITAAVLPCREQFPVNVEIINGKYVAFQKAEMTDEKGGIILHDRELADMLLAYINRNISSGCPTQLKGAKNIAKWLENQFGVSKNLKDS